VKPDNIEQADQDYYDEYWKDFWKRLRDKYADKVESNGQK